MHIEPYKSEIESYDAMDIELHSDTDTKTFGDTDLEPLSAKYITPHGLDLIPTFRGEGRGGSMCEVF